MASNFAEGKKQFATPVTADVIDAFKKKCKDNKVKQNEIIEGLMKAYINDEVEVEIKKITTVSYSIKAK